MKITKIIKSIILTFTLVCSILLIILMCLEPCFPLLITSQLLSTLLFTSSIGGVLWISLFWNNALNDDCE